jgi:hypothetical protein
MSVGSPGIFKICAVFGEGSVSLQPWKGRRPCLIRSPKGIDVALEQSTSHLVSVAGPGKLRTSPSRHAAFSSIVFKLRGDGREGVAPESEICMTRVCTRAMGDEV